MNTLKTDLRHLEVMYQRAIAARDLEVQQLVQRNNFFMIFQGVLFAGLLQSAGCGKIIPVVSFVVCIAGFVASLFQIGMAAGAKFWQERWEAAVVSSEQAMHNLLQQDPDQGLVVEAFSSGDEFINKLVEGRMKGKLLGRLVTWRFSVSRIPIIARIAFLMLWLILILVQIEGSFTIPTWIIGFKSAA